MRTGFKIKSITNNLDGSTAEVMLSGTPSGSVTFQASRTPDMALPGTVPATLSAGVYTLTFAAPVLWYVTATDSTNATAPVPVFVELASDSDLNLCGKKLESVLNSNRAALDIALQMCLPLPGIKWKQIVYGSNIIVRDFPAILVTKGMVIPSKVAFPYTWDYTYRFEIFAMVMHQDNTSYESAMAAFSERLVKILHQPAYFALCLPSGTIVNNCTCEKGESGEMQTEDNKFYSVGSIVWTGDALLTDAMFGMPA